jgi:hypothetical protein
MTTTNIESMDNMTTMSNIPTRTGEDVTQENSIPESEFNRINMETLGNKIRITDSDEDRGLEMFCYVRCGTSDSSLLHQCRGVVFNKEKLVMRAFPYTIEYTNNDVEQVTNTFDESSFSGYKFYDSHEGALIRMFNFDGKWYTSTHRKLNSFSSKWGSKESFGSSFKKALEYEVTVNTKLREVIPEGDEGLLERFQATLDINKQYMFLVRHCREHRIVCNYPENPTVYHVGTFVDGKLVMDVDCNIPQPRQHDFKTINEVLDYVSAVDIRNIQGVICFFPNNKQVKIVNKEYQEFFHARGNEPSIKFRYIQMRMNQKVNGMLCRLYPSMVESFDEIENSIYTIAKNIYSAYVQRFIKKRFVTVPTEEFAVIRECHRWHEEDRVNHRISLQKVISVLNAQTPTNINHMIRRFKAEKIEQVKQQKIVANRVKSGTPSASPMVFSKPGSKVVSPLQLPVQPVHVVPPINLVVST